MPNHQPDEDALPSDRSEKDLFLSALEIEDPTKREAWLEEACGDDAALHARLVELLEAEEDEDGDEFLVPNKERLGEVVSAVGRELREDESEADTMPSDVDAEPTPGDEAGVSEQVGDTIDRYKLLQRLGEGGGGVVYLAKQSEPVKRKVALKVIKLGMDTRQVVARFEAERQALAMMDHPNIAKVLDGGATASGRPYFVMEVVRGVPITKFCDDNNLSTVERLELFTQVCEAVQHAHQKGIIHRDLKPDNILVTMLEDRPLPKVIDFGIAKATQQELTEKTIFTQMGHFIGTPAYMSPEQAQLTEYDIDTRSDIYALGVVLYELLTGQTPFDTRELLKAGYDEIRRVIAEDEPAKPSTRLSSLDDGALTDLAGHRHTEARKLSRSVRGDLDWIVMKALEKDRRRRYETANALALDVGRHLRNEPVAAGPPTAGYRLKKFVRRNRRSLLSGAVAAVALLGGLSVAGMMWLNERERVTKVEEQAGTLIGQAEDLMETNAAAEDYYDDEAFRRAEALVEQLTLLGDLDRAGEELRTRRERLVAAVTSERRDRDLILGIEEALMIRMGIGTGGSKKDKSAEVQRSLAEAFNQHGIDPTERPVHETVAWLGSRREEVRGRIRAGMLEWLIALEDKSPERSERLFAVLAKVDTDPWRQKLRLALVEGDRAKVLELAESEDLNRQPILTIVRIAYVLGAAEYGAVEEKLLRRAQREHPESFWTNFSLGNILHDRLDVGGRGYALGGEGFTLSASISEYSKLRPEYDEAIGFLRAAVAARPDAGAGWVNLGFSLSGAGRLDDAIASYRRAIELKPDFWVAHLNLGSVLKRQGKLDKAIEAYQEAIRLDPALAAAHLNLGDALREQGKLDEAVASCRKAIELNPKLAPAHVNLGYALRKQGKLDKAIESYQEAIRLDPELALAHSNLGTVLGEQDKLDEAIASCQEAIRLDPNYAAARYNLGTVLEKQGKLEQAIASYQEAIRLDPNYAAALYNLGNVLHGEGKLEQAAAYYRRAIDLDPNFTKALNNLGNVLRDQGKLDDAVASYQRAIELNPNDTKALNNLGNVLKAQGKLDEAIASHRKAIESDPADATAYVNLGVDLMAQGKPDGAIESYQEAIRLDPNNSAAHNNLGAVREEQGKLEQAIAFYREAIRLDPNYAIAYANLGRVLYGQGKFPQAAASYRTAIQKTSDFVEAHESLGTALLQQGKVDKAIAAYLESLRLEPNPPFLSTVQDMEEKDRQVLGTLREKGVGDPSVLALVREFFGRLELPDPPKYQVPEFWEEHREEVAEALGSADVRTITLLKMDPDDFTRTPESAKALAQELAGKLAAGADFGELAKQFSDDGFKADGGLRSDVTWGEELSEALDLAAFTLEVGAISEVIEVPNGYFLLKVEKRQAGEADDFEDPKVREVATALLNAQRRKEMEQAYLERLQERIEEEDAGKAAE